MKSVLISLIIFFSATVSHAKDLNQVVTRFNPITQERVEVNASEIEPGYLYYFTNPTFETTYLGLALDKDLAALENYRRNLIRAARESSSVDEEVLQRLESDPLYSVVSTKAKIPFFTIGEGTILTLNKYGRLSNRDVSEATVWKLQKDSNDEYQTVWRQLAINDLKPDVIFSDMLSRNHTRWERDGGTWTFLHHYRLELNGERTEVDFDTVRRVPGVYLRMGYNADTDDWYQQIVYHLVDEDFLRIGEKNTVYHLILLGTWIGAEDGYYQTIVGDDGRIKLWRHPAGDTTVTVSPGPTHGGRGSSGSSGGGPFGPPGETR